MKQEQDTVFEKEMEKEKEQKQQKQQKTHSFQGQKSLQELKVMVAEIKQKTQYRTRKYRYRKENKTDFKREKFC